MDEDWYLAVNGFARDTAWLHWFMPPYALWGGLVALSVLLIACWLWARRQTGNVQLVAVAVLTGISAVTAVVLNQQLISPFIARTRPCSAISGVVSLLPCTGDYSMPSDHCIIAGAFAAGIWVLNRKAGYLAILLALVLAFGRVYTGMHYPTDVITGLLAGAVLALAIVLGLRQPLTQLILTFPGPVRALLTGTSRTNDERESIHE